MFFAKNGFPLRPHRAAQISKICQKCFPRASLGPLPKTVSKYVAFLTSQTLENQAPARAGAQFSLCGPTSKKSSKWSPTTFLLGSPWSLKRSQCGKLGDLKIHSKINPGISENCQKWAPNGGDTFGGFRVFGIFFQVLLRRWLLEAPKAPKSRKK